MQLVQAGVTVCRTYPDTELANQWHSWPLFQSGSWTTQDGGVVPSAKAQKHKH